MRKLSIAALLGVLLSLSSCQAIGDIFKAGVWVGILFVGVIIAVVVFIIAKVGGGGK